MLRHPIFWFFSKLSFVLLLAAGFLLLCSLFASFLLPVLSDSKFPQVSRTPLSILSDFNSAVVWTVSILSLIYSPNLFSNLFSRALEIVPSALTTIGITVTFIFCSFFCPLARSKYLFIFSLSFIFTLWSDGTELIIFNPLFFLFFLFLFFKSCNKDRYHCHINVSYPPPPKKKPKTKQTNQKQKQEHKKPKKKKNQKKKKKKKNH